MSVRAVMGRRASMRSRVGLVLAAVAVVLAAGFATAGLVAEASPGAPPPVATADAR